MQRVYAELLVGVGDIAVDVIRKDIKNVHLSVYPPTGRVRISAPERMKLDTIRIFAISSSAESVTIRTPDQLLEMLEGRANRIKGLR